MHAMIATAVLALLAGAAAAEEPATSRRTVNLNSPGVMAELKVSRPEDYNKIVAILGGIERAPNGEVWRWASADFDVTNGFASNILLTTWPPQRDFGFTLGDTTYRGRTTLSLRHAILDSDPRP